MEQQHNLITLQGTVESISFRADSGFTVAELEYGNELVTIVGELTDVAQGIDAYRLLRYASPLRLAIQGHDV